MRTATRLPLQTTILTILLPLCTTTTTSTPHPTDQPGPTAAPPVPAPPTDPPAAVDNTTRAVNLHCYQCTGESTDPNEHCTDSGWVSIPHAQKLSFRYLCPDYLNDFCMKSIERWESTRPGVADKYRTKRGCSAKTRTSQQSGDKLGAGTKFIVSNGCTDSRQNPVTGAYVQLCFCDQPLCNAGGRWTVSPVQLLLLLLLVGTRL